MPEVMVTVPGIIGQMSEATAKAAGLTYDAVVNVPTPALAAIPASPAEIPVTTPLESPKEGDIEWYQEHDLVVNVGRPSTASEIVESQGVGLPDVVLEQAQEAVKAGEGKSPQVAISFIAESTGKNPDLDVKQIVQEMGEKKATEYLVMAGVENAGTAAKQAAEAINNEKVITEVLGIKLKPYEQLSLSPADVAKLVDKEDEKTTVSRLEKVGFGDKAQVMVNAAVEQKKLLVAYTEPKYLTSITDADGNTTYSVDIVSLVGKGLTNEQIDKAAKDLVKLGFDSSIFKDIQNASNFAHTNVKVGDGDQWMAKSDLNKLSIEDKTSVLKTGKTIYELQLEDKIASKLNDLNGEARDQKDFGLRTALFMADSKAVDEETARIIKSVQDKAREQGIDNSRIKTVASFWNSLSTKEKRAIAEGNVVRPHGMEVVKESGMMLASMIPVVGTVMTWNQMSTGWKIVSVVTDILCIAPMLKTASGAVKIITPFESISGNLDKAVRTARELSAARSELRTATEALHNLQVAKAPQKMVAALVTKIESVKGAGASMQDGLRVRALAAEKNFQNVISDLYTAKPKDLKFVEQALGKIGFSDAAIELASSNKQLLKAQLELDKFVKANPSAASPVGIPGRALKLGKQIRLEEAVETIGAGTEKLRIQYLDRLEGIVELQAKADSALDSFSRIMNVGKVTVQETPATLIKEVNAAKVQTLAQFEEKLQREMQPALSELGAEGKLPKNIGAKAQESIQEQIAKLKDKYSANLKAFKEQVDDLVDYHLSTNREYTKPTAMPRSGIAARISSIVQGKEVIAMRKAMSKAEKLQAKLDGTSILDTKYNDLAGQLEKAQRTAADKAFKLGKYVKAEEAHPVEIQNASRQLDKALDKLKAEKTKLDKISSKAKSKPSQITKQQFKVDKASANVRKAYAKLHSLTDEADYSMVTKEIQKELDRITEQAAIRQKYQDASRANVSGDIQKDFDNLLREEAKPKPSPKEGGYGTGGRLSKEEYEKMQQAATKSKVEYETKQAEQMKEYKKTKTATKEKAAEPETKAKEKVKEKTEKSESTTVSKSKITEEAKKTAEEGKPKFGMTPKPKVRIEEQRIPQEVRGRQTLANIAKEYGVEHEVKAIGIPLKTRTTTVNSDTIPDIIRHAADTTANNPNSAADIVTDAATVIGLQAAIKAASQGATQSQIEAVIQAAVQNAVKVLTNTITDSQAKESVKSHAQNIVHAAVKNATQAQTKIETKTKTSTKVVLMLKTKAGTQKKTDKKILPRVHMPSSEDNAHSTKKPTVLHPDGTITWRMGKLRKKIWHILEPPYHQHNYSIEVSDTPPRGAKVTTSNKVAETVQEFGGKLGKDLVIDIGAFDMHLMRGRPNPTTRFTRDVHGKSRHGLSAKEAKVIVSGMR